MLRSKGKAVGPLIQKRAVDLVGIAQQDDLRPLARTGNDPLDLIGRSILRFIHDQIRFHKRSAPDKVQRLSLNDAPGKHLFYFSRQFLLILKPFLFAGIDELLQIIDHRAHQR